MNSPLTLPKYIVRIITDLKYILKTFSSTNLVNFQISSPISRGNVTGRICRGNFEGPNVHFRAECLTDDNERLFNDRQIDRKSPVPLITVNVEFLETNEG